MICPSVEIPIFGEEASPRPNVVSANFCVLTDQRGSLANFCDALISLLAFDYEVAGVAAFPERDEEHFPIDFAGSDNFLFSFASDFFRTGSIFDVNLFQAREQKIERFDRIAHAVDQHVGGIKIDRSEERRVGKECRCGSVGYQWKIECA